MSQPALERVSAWPLLGCNRFSIGFKPVTGHIGGHNLDARIADETRSSIDPLLLRLWKVRGVFRTGKFAEFLRL